MAHVSLIRFYCSVWLSLSVPKPVVYIAVTGVAFKNNDPAPHVFSIGGVGIFIAKNNKTTALDLMIKRSNPELKIFEKSYLICSKIFSINFSPNTFFK